MQNPTCQFGFNFTSISKLLPDKILFFVMHAPHLLIDVALVAAILWHQLCDFLYGFSKLVVDSLIKTDLNQESLRYYVKSNTKVFKIKFSKFIHFFKIHLKGDIFRYQFQCIKFEYSPFCINSTYFYEFSKNL